MNNLKIIVYFLFSLITDKLYSRRGVNLKKVQLLFSRLCINSGNHFFLEKCKIVKSHFQIEGTGNRVEFINYDTCRYASQYPKIHNANIKIVGRNNSILIGSGAVLCNLNIVMRGDGNTVNIGKKVTCNGATLVCMGGGVKINIGDGCLLADEINMWATDSHPIYDESNKLINPSDSINISDNVWVGKQVNILKGVTIGEGSIIGMRSTVTHDIKPFTLNVGSPSYVIRENVHWVREFIKS